jgi:hypothetical protein
LRRIISHPYSGVKKSVQIKPQRRTSTTSLHLSTASPDFPFLSLEGAPVRTSLSDKSKNTETFAKEHEGQKEESLI